MHKRTLKKRLQVISHVANFIPTHFHFVTFYFYSSIIKTSQCKLNHVLQIYFFRSEVFYWIVAENALDTNMLLCVFLKGNHIQKFEYDYHQTLIRTLFRSFVSDSSLDRLTLLWQIRIPDQIKKIIVTIFGVFPYFTLGEMKWHQTDKVLY